jgi:transposase-like protein
MLSGVTHKVVRPKTPSMLLIEARRGRSIESDIVDLYIRRGLMQEQVAAELGIDSSTLSRWMRELGIDARPRGRGSVAAFEAAR